MKQSSNQIASRSQYSKDVEGYVFDGADGSQMAIWTCKMDGISTEHVHDFDEYFMVVQGKYTLLIGGEKISLGVGQEYFIPKGKPHAGEYLAGTRTIHAFGGKRVQRATGCQMHSGNAISPWNKGESMHLDTKCIHAGTISDPQTKGVNTNMMKLIRYPDVSPTHFNTGPAKAVAARVVIGKGDGAQNFCMRVFEIAPGGHTPKHSHEWEHEMFIHSGQGEVFGNGQWQPLQPGKVVFIPGNEEHQLRNPGQELLVVVCLVPATAPEL